MDYHDDVASVKAVRARVDGLVQEIVHLRWRDAHGRGRCRGKGAVGGGRGAERKSILCRTCRKIHWYVKNRVNRGPYRLNNNWL